MANHNVITGRQLIKKMPGVVPTLPKLIKGILIANSRNKEKPVGLGLCFERAVKRNPHGLAIKYQNVEIAYSDLNIWVNKIAHYFLSTGIQKGDSVGIMIENRPELLATVLACAKMGAVSAMINTSQKGKVLTHSISLASPKLMIVGEECLATYENVREKTNLPDNKHLYFADLNTLSDTGSCPSHWLNLASELTHQPQHNPKQTQQIFSEDPCFYIYTSGTTGLPKAVIFNHGRFMKLYGTFGYITVRLKKDDRLYVPLPFYHATALGVCWSTALAGSSCLVIARKFSASRFWSDIKEHQATAFAYVGELCRYLIEQAPKPGDADNLVRVMVGNGMRPAIWPEFKKRFGIPRVMEFYGSSEGNIAFTNLLNFEKTVGMSPLPYAIVQYDRETDKPIRDADGNMSKVAKGEAGLLIGHITEKAPFHGYTDPAKTESSILSDVFEPGDRWFNTGDIMRQMGFRHAQFVDRTGDTYRWKGENISTTEVEMLIEEVEAVNEAVVYGVEIPNTNGRAGMASIRLNGSVEEFDFSQFLLQMKTNMSDYSIPVFLSINEGVELTGTFKHVKGPLKEKGFDVQKNTDPLYVWLPKTDKYVPLTQQMQKDIEQGLYRY